MPTIKLTKWDAESLHYACDKGDKMDMCLYIHWEKIPLPPSKSEETEDGMEHTFDIWEDISEELGEGKHVVSIRVNGKSVEKHTIIISNPEADEESDED